MRREVAAALRELLPALQDARAARLDAEDWDAAVELASDANTDISGRAEQGDDEPGWSGVPGSAGMSWTEEPPPPPPPPPPPAVPPPAPEAVAAWLRARLVLDGLGTAATERMMRHLRNGGLIEEANQRRAKRGLPPFHEDGTVRRDA